MAWQGFNGRGVFVFSVERDSYPVIAGTQLKKQLAGGMKVVSICTMRYNRDTAEPVMLSQVNELSSFGFFQRQG